LQKDFVAINLALTYLAMELKLWGGKIMDMPNFIRGKESDIVPGIFIFLPGIAKANYQKHMRSKLSDFMVKV